MAAGPLSRLRAASEVLESVDEESLPWTYVTSSDSPGTVGQGSDDASTYTRQGVAIKRPGSLSRKRRKDLQSDTTKPALIPGSVDWTAEEDYSLCQAVLMSVQGASGGAGVPSARLVRELQTVSLPKLLAECLVPARDHAAVSARVRSASFRRAFVRFLQGRTRQDQAGLARVSAVTTTEDTPATESCIERKESVQSEASLARKGQESQHLVGVSKSGPAKSVASLETGDDLESSSEEALKVEGSPVRGEDSSQPMMKGSSRSRGSQMQQGLTNQDTYITGATVPVGSKGAKPETSVITSNDRVVEPEGRRPEKKSRSRLRSKGIQHEPTDKSRGQAAACQIATKPGTDADLGPDVFTSDDQSCHLGGARDAGEAGKRRKRQTAARGGTQSCPATSEGEPDTERPTPRESEPPVRANSESGLQTGEARAAEGRIGNVTARRKRKIVPESKETQNVGSAEDDGTDYAPHANVQPFGNSQGNKNVEGKKSFRSFRKKFLDRCLDMQHSALGSKLPAQKHGANAGLQVEEYLTAQQLQQSRKSILDACLLAQKDD